MLTRRQFAHTTIAGIGLAAAGALSAKTHSRGTFDPRSEKDLMTALAKLRGSTEKELVIWWLDGTLYGVVDLVPTPLWHMETISFSSWEATGEAEYLMVHRELSLKKDPATGELVEQLTNPYTGELLEVEHKPFVPAPLLLTADTARLPADAPVKPEFTHRLQTPSIIGDDFWLGEDMYAVLPAFQPGMKPWRANDITTWHGSLNQVTDPDVAWADATMVYQGMYNWRPWLKMGDIDGHHFARMAGRKLRSIEEIPDSYLTAVAKVDPEFVTTGAKAIGL